MKEKLLEIKEALGWWGINSLLKEEEDSDGTDMFLEWWAADASLNEIAIWSDGVFVFQRGLGGKQLIHHTVSTVREFSDFWPYFISLSIPYSPLVQRAVNELLEKIEAAHQASTLKPWERR